MKMRTLSAYLVGGLGLAVATAHVAHAQRRGAPAPRTARTNETPAARCTALSALWVADARAALETLGVTPAADFEALYRRQMRNFDATCTALTPEQLACLETATNSIEAVGSCAINEGKDFNSRLNPPMVASDFVTWQVHKHEARSEAATREAIAQLTGSWRRADRYSEDIFAVNADGTATHVNTRGEQTRTHQGTIDVLSPTHIQARMGAGGTYNWGFFVDGTRVLFSNQNATGAYPIAPRGTTRLGFNGQFAVIENVSTTPTCKAFGPRLEPMEATCAWEGSGDTRKFVVTVAAHRFIESGSNAPAYPNRFVERRGHLIPDGDSNFWTRVAATP